MAFSFFELRLNLNPVAGESEARKCWAANVDDSGVRVVWGLIRNVPGVALISAG